MRRVNGLIVMERDDASEQLGTFAGCCVDVDDALNLALEAGSAARASAEAAGFYAQRADVYGEFHSLHHQAEAVALRRIGHTLLTLAAPTIYDRFDRLLEPPDDC